MSRREHTLAADRSRRMAEHRKQVHPRSKWADWSALAVLVVWIAVAIFVTGSPWYYLLFLALCAGGPIGLIAALVYIASVRYRGQHRAPEDAEDPVPADPPSEPAKPTFDAEATRPFSAFGDSPADPGSQAVA